MSQPEEDFFHIKREIDRQNKWLNQLHDFSKSLHHYTKYIEQSNTKHKKDIVDKINNISDWIDHFNQSHIELRREILTLKKDLRLTLKQDFETYHEILIKYINSKLEEIPDYESLKQDLLMRDEKKEYEPIINEDPHNNVNNVMHYNTKVELTNPEKELLSLLFNENKPLTYKNIAKKLNKSVNSIRVYMNSLKSKKDVVDEFKGPNGQKIFSVKNSELVKTLFNI